MSSDTFQIYDKNKTLIPFEFNTADTVEIPSNIQLKLLLGDENRLRGGSYGTVYKLAMKVIPDIRSRDWSILKREIDVPQERDILGCIVHLYGSFTCYDSGTSSGSQFSVTPLCPDARSSISNQPSSGSTSKLLCSLYERARGNLFTPIRKPRHGKIDKVYRICSGLIILMNAIYQEKDGFTAVHYDSKPANILIFPDRFDGGWVWKIADFGMAQLRSTGEDLGVDPTTLGSFGYFLLEHFDKDGTLTNQKHRTRSMSGHLDAYYLKLQHGRVRKEAKRPSSNLQKIERIWRKRSVIGQR